MDKSLSEQLELIFNDAVDRPTALMAPKEIYLRADQSLLEELKEDRRFERKPARIQPRELGDYFVMFANTPPDGGVIVVGMTDEGIVEGCSCLHSDRINEIERTSAVYCPDVQFDTKRLEVTNREGNLDFVILFYVQYHNRKLIENPKHEAFIRRGESKQKLTEEQKLELKQSKGQIELENEACKLDYPEDFEIEAMKVFCANYARSRGLRYNPQLEDVLGLCNLGERTKTDFIPNNACALLFAKHPNKVFPGCKIRFLRFQGEEEGTGQKLNVIKDIIIEGHVPELIEEAANVIESQVREFTRLGPDRRFFSAPEYPKDAWYEAVVNACVHRSYVLKNMNIFVKMFDNRLVIESPGGFPALVTPENIYEMHNPRNPYLMNALFYLDFVKCAHEGTRRMRDSMKAMYLPAPEFTQKELDFALVQVILRNNISHRKVFVDTEAAKILGKAIIENLNELERRIVNYLAEKQEINVSDTQRLTGKSWPACKKLLTGLANKGIVEHVHKHKTEKTRDPGAYFALRRPRKT